MRRPLRILLNALTVLSVLLFVAAITLWLRSYWVADVVSWASGDVGHAIYTERGGVYYSVDEILGMPPDRPPTYRSSRLGPRYPPAPNERLGFSRQHLGGGPLGVP